MNNKIGLVTMCRKAGKLVMGMDMVKDACNTGKACAVFAACLLYTLTLPTKRIV